jgi:hypothetical protein
VNALAPITGSVVPQVSRQQLIRLRSRHGWPDNDELTEIGDCVWQSIMAPLAPAYVASRNQSESASRGLRLVVSVSGEEPEITDAALIGFRELPLEALHSPQHGFLASNPFTPISRSPTPEPDRDPLRAPLPLRILVVVASPRDRPTADIEQEKDGIRQALSQLTGPGGPVELEFCDPPTRAELVKRLRDKQFHILHFVGHGDFDIVGDDPSQRPHLVFEGPRAEGEAHGIPDPLDAVTLESLLRNKTVRLVVITACASASPTPDERPYEARAYDGVAQTLIRGVSGVSAVVAMQFDLESDAAVTFSEVFYTNLLRPERRLDEVVALCREALGTAKGVGHRSWVTPVVYWRCKDGKVFEPVGLRAPLPPEVQKQLIEIDIVLQTTLGHIMQLRQQPQPVQDAAVPLVIQWRQKVEELQLQRDLLLGETLRLRGGSVAAGETIACPLTLRLRTEGQIGDVSVRLQYPADRVTFEGMTAGASTPGGELFRGDPAPGELTLEVRDASRGTVWAADEQELAVLRFRVNPGVTDPFLKLNIVDVQATRDGEPAVFDPLHAVLFVT